jgi:hypothetical protein
MSPIVRAALLFNLFGAALLFSALGGLGAGVAAGAIAFAVAVAVPVSSVHPRMIALESIAMLGLAAYSLAIPIHQLLYNDYPDAPMMLAFRLCLIAGAGMVAGNLLLSETRRSSPGTTDFQSVPWDWKRAHMIGWGVFAVGVLTAAIAIGATIGFSAYLNAGYAGRVLLKREAGPVELGLYHAVFGLVFINLARLKDIDLRDSRTLLIIVAAASLLFVGYVSFLGIRRPSFLLLLSMAMLWGVAGGGYNRLAAALLGIPAMLSFAIFASFRQVLSDHGTDAAYQYVSNNVSLDWLDLSKTELGAPFRVLMDVIGTWHEPARLGKTYIDTLPYALPQGLRPGLLSLSQEYTTRNFSPDYISIGGNMGFFPVAEAWLNFGLIGVFIVFFLLGVLISAIQSRTLSRMSPAWLLTFSLAAPWFIFFLRTDLASWFKVFVYSVGPPAFIALALANIREPRHATA